MTSFGFNFRENLAFVTDPANTQFVKGASSTMLYPTTAGGITFGWDTNTFMNGADRDAGIDARLAGVNSVDASHVQTFQVDLTVTGIWAVHLAIGDASFNSAGTTGKIEIFDNTTLLQTLSLGTLIVGGTWNDATNVNRASAAAWVANEAPINLTFASTTFKMKLTCGTVGVAVAHLNLVAPAAVSSVVLLNTAPA